MSTLEQQQALDKVEQRHEEILALEKDIKVMCVCCVRVCLCNSCGPWGSVYISDKAQVPVQYI